MTNRSRRWLIWATLCASTAFAPAISLGRDWSAVDARLAQIVATGEASGAGLRIDVRGETVYERTAGSWTADQFVPIASSTKLFAATAIATLIDDRLLSLSTPVIDVLPWFDDSDPAKAAITLGQLLSHTSGLPGLATPTPCLDNTTTTLDACVRQIAAVPLSYPPGAGFAYGGASFQVAGLMAATVTGQSFVQLFDERLVQPCNLRWSWLSTTNPRVAGGGMTDTASTMKVLDIQRTGRCGRNRIVSRRVRRAMSANWSASFVSPSYGLGLWRDRVNGGGQSLVISSAGAFGTLPWFDRKRHYTAYLSMLVFNNGVGVAARARTDLVPLIEQTLSEAP